jgi:hypothetical protein
VNPEGSLTDYFFEYGPTTSYGSKVTGSAGDGSGAYPVSETLSGLAPSTTYHYRLAATSGEGSSNGADQTFTTPAFPAVATEAASGVTGTKATPAGSVNPKGSATTYSFEYGTTTAYGSTTAGTSAGSGTSAVPVSTAIAGLLSETTYHYRLVATNSQGSARGGDLTFTTTPNVEAQLAGLAVTHPFDGSSPSVAAFASSWSALGWASPKGEDSTTGWRSLSSYPASNGAYYSTAATDSGPGIAAVAKLAVKPTGTGRYISVWLDMPTPGSTRAGYELRLTEATANVLELRLFKWQSGSPSELAGKSGLSVSTGSSLALVDRGSSVSAWIDSGSGYSQLLAASDSTYSSGKGGVEAAGTTSRLTNFRFGALPPPAGGPEGRWYLRNANTTGAAEVEFIYGASTLIPVAGDWNGDGIDTPGAYKPSTGEWFLRNSSTGGTGEVNFTYGGCCDLIPIAGDWNNDGKDTIGLYKPSEGRWFLRNTNSSGVADLEFIYGSGGEPIAGDWNNDGKDTIGLFGKEAGPDRWFLRNSNTAGVADLEFTYGSGSDLTPLAGDWNNDGTDTPGLYKQSLGQWFLRNSNSTGTANIEFVYGGASDSRPVGGDWNKDGIDSVAVVR